MSKEFGWLKKKKSKGGKRDKQLLNKSKRNAG